MQNLILKGEPQCTDQFIMKTGRNVGDIGEVTMLSPKVTAVCSPSCRLASDVEICTGNPQDIRVPVPP